MFPFQLMNWNSVEREPISFRLVVRIVEIKIPCIVGRYPIALILHVFVHILNKMSERPSWLDPQIP